VPDTWREKAVPAQEAFTNVIKAIAQHEKVVVGINPSLYKKLAPSLPDDSERRGDFDSL
jgi:agmatine/peptidylarginine deiminase